MVEGTLDVFDMPVMEVKNKRQVNAQLLANILAQHEAPVYIEQVGAMPGQGVTSMFNFGKSFGICLGVAAGLRYPTTTVIPNQWQRAVKTQCGKDGNRHRACQLFPAYAHLFARKKDDGRADAALISYWASLYAESVD